MKSDLKRCHLILPDDLVREVRERFPGQTFTDLVRRGLKILLVFEEAERNHSKIVIRHADTLDQELLQW